ncbi:MULTISPECIES: ExbD/TolR family protein [Hyphobacterium]|uniref:ExbD/TolR family protein n=1 Tax=Hyphobacterium vulgare TaxID=1736751 RepID=A0ABV6ZUZ6_9PROT
MARRASRVNTEEEEIELNMTPMLDVVFILLIFFIVTSVFVKEPGVDVTRPDAVTTDRERPSILIAVTAADEVWINRRVYDINGVRGAVEQLIEENPRAEAMIQGDAAASSGLVFEVQEILGDMGVPVNISTRNN